MSGAEESESRERAEGNAGGVRVEREVRPASKIEITRALSPPNFGGDCARAKSHVAEPKGKDLELLRESEGAEVRCAEMMAENHGLIGDE